MGQGQEERLRHFLEGVVEQANVVHVVPDQKAEHAESESGSEEPARLDAEMTESFRSFAAD